MHKQVKPSALPVLRALLYALLAGTLIGRNAVALDESAWKMPGLVQETISGRHLSPERPIFGFEWAKTRGGVRVTSVLKESPAGQAGLLAGDWLLANENGPLPQLSDSALRALFARKTLTLRVRQSDGQVRTLNVTRAAPRAFAFAKKDLP